MTSKLISVTRSNHELLPKSVKGLYMGNAKKMKTPMAFVNCLCGKYLRQS